MTIVFDPQINVSNTDLVIVGLGGTGSALARHVARMVYDMRERGLHLPRSIKFIDPDVVEPKNCGRQMFTVANVGQYKAEVLARNFNYALGLDIEFYNEPFSPKMVDYHSAILLGAVDNYRARQELAQTRATWIDCGNHHNSGQVVIGNTSRLGDWRAQSKRAMKMGTLSANEFARHGTAATLHNEREQWSSLPNASLIFPALLQPDPDERPANVIPMSCADLIATGQQHLLINDLVASVAAQYLYKLLHRQDITTFITYIDGDSLSMRSIPITRDDIEAYVGAA